MLSIIGLLVILTIVIMLLSGRVLPSVAMTIAQCSNDYCSYCGSAISRIFTS
jgi:Mg2+/citrate symporter